MFLLDTNACIQAMNGASPALPIGANDMLIAATALAYDLVLVTHNGREFSRVAGLRLEDWEAEP